MQSRERRQMIWKGLRTRLWRGGDKPSAQTWPRPGWLLVDHTVEFLLTEVKTKLKTCET